MRDEWPTLVLLVLTYGAFAILTLFAHHVPIVLLVALLAGVVALHSSLQHEVLHGHPFRTEWICDLTVFPPLGLFVPYLRFKDTHLAHHFDPNLTDPYDDPESNYLDAVVWKDLPHWIKRLRQMNNTLLGRMTFGPAISLLTFYKADLGRIAGGDLRVIRSYAEHGLGLACVIGWLHTFSEIPLWAYVISAYAGMSLLKIRTFLEHQAHERCASRSVIIEDRGPLSFLFLNNNYHAVHHAHPQVVWHKLPTLFRDRRDHFLKRNGGYAYTSYRDVFATHLLRAKDPVAHPLWTRNNRTKPLDP